MVFVCVFFSGLYVQCVSPIDQMRVFTLLGLRRSGNHMFAGMIIKNFRRVLYFNDVGENDASCAVVLPTATQFEPDIQNRLVLRIEDDPECVLMSFEDMDVKSYDAALDRWKVLYPHLFRRSSGFTECIVLRNILNCLASRLRSRVRHEENGDSCMLRFVEINDGILDAWSSHRNASRQRFHMLSYDEVCSGKDTTDVAASLGLSDFSRLGTIPGFFGGSSFSGDDKDTDELTRWERYKHHPLLQKAMKRFSPIFD